LLGKYGVLLERPELLADIGFWRKQLCILDRKHTKLCSSDDLAGELKIYFVRRCFGHLRDLLCRRALSLLPISVNGRFEFLHCPATIRSTKRSMPGMVLLYDSAKSPSRQFEHRLVWFLLLRS